MPIFGLLLKAESILERFDTVLLDASGCFLRFGCGSDAKGGLPAGKDGDLYVQHLTELLLKNSASKLV